MSDVSTQPGGQPGNPSQPAAPAVPAQPAGGETGTEPKYMTVEQAQAWKDEILRTTQGRTDKAISSQVTSKVDQALAALRNSGVTVSAEEESGLRQTLKEPAAETSQENPAQGTPAQSPLDPALMISANLVKQAGITLGPDDAEFAKIAPFIGKDGIVADPTGMLAAVKGAIVAKVARETAKGNPSARVPLGGGTTTDAPTTTMSPREKIEYGLQQKKRG